LCKQTNKIMTNYMFIYEGAIGKRKVDGAFNLRAERVFSALRQGVRYLSKLDIKPEKVKVREWPKN